MNQSPLCLHGSVVYFSKVRTLKSYLAREFPTFVSNSVKSGKYLHTLTVEFTDEEPGDCRRPP